MRAKCSKCTVCKAEVACAMCQSALYCSQRCADMDWKDGHVRRCAGLLAQSTNLWLQHVWLTREYLKEAVTRGQFVQQVADALLANQKDLGNFYDQIYPGSGNAVYQLLKEHILIATRIVAAAMAKDAARLSAEEEAWQANGRQIAAAFKSLDAAYDIKHLEQHMREHLSSTKDELVALLEGRSGLSEFERVRRIALGMSQYLLLRNRSRSPS
jgi:MYND finger